MIGSVPRRGESLIDVTGFLTFSRESAAVEKSSALAVVVCGLASMWAVALLAISQALAGDAGIGYALAFIVSGAAVV